MQKNGAFNNNGGVKYLVGLTCGQGVNFTLNVKQTMADFLMIPVYRVIFVSSESFNKKFVDLWLFLKILH
jgi:hypothetical protein